VINSAGWTDVEGAENQVEACRAANVEGVAVVAAAARQCGVRLVQISTDFVFDGSKTLWEVDDPVGPLSIYGQSKWEGEQVARTWENALVVRVQGLYGEGGRNFPSRLKGMLLRGEPISLDRVRYSQPTWVGVAAQGVLKLAEKAGPGTYHISCSGRASWADFAGAMAEELGVELVEGGERAGKARRPVNSCFSHRSVEGIVDLVEWREGLRRYLGLEHRR
jgi:dTDP-4-dehydrorhamnose reductase